MRNLILAFLFVVSLQIMAQDFAPIGAKWYYTESFAFSGDISFLKIESVKDTVVQGKDCKVLLKTHFLGCSDRPTINEIVYSEDSVVYFWDNGFDKFQTLYNFKTKKGDFWTILMKSTTEQVDTIKVFVDSIASTEIKNKSYKTLYVSYHANYLDYSQAYPSIIVYQIGDLNYLFNFFPIWAMSCDFNFSNGLRCYEDAEIGYYSRGIADSCTYTHKWTSVESIKDNQLKVDFGSNPTHGEIKISCRDNTNYIIFLLDNLGRIIKTGSFRKETNLDISTYPNGMYFILIQDDKGMTNRTKIIKN